MKAELEIGATYVVMIKGKKQVATYFCTTTGKFWYVTGDEQKVPFKWATKVIRKVRL